MHVPGAIEHDVEMRSSAKQLRDGRGMARGPGEERGRDVGLVRRDEGGEVGRGPAGLQPLPPVEAGVPEVPLVSGRFGASCDAVGVPALRRHPLGAGEPRDHRGPELLEDRQVAVLLVLLPRDQDHRVSPAG